MDRNAFQKLTAVQAIRAYLGHAIARAGVDKKVTLHKLRHTYATREFFKRLDTQQAAAVGCIYGF